MVYEVRIKKAALKELSVLPKKTVARISEKIDLLQQNPYPMGSKKLKGSEDEYRFRVGDYRILYTVYNKILVIEVIKIGHRKDVYK